MKMMSSNPNQNRLVAAAELEPGASCEFGSPKVPFIYYVSTCTAQNFIWLPNFSKNWFFFAKMKEFLFQHYILTRFSSFSLKYLVHKGEEKCSKNSWKCWGWSNVLILVSRINVGVRLLIFEKKIKKKKLKNDRNALIDVKMH